MTLAMGPLIVLFELSIVTGGLDRPSRSPPPGAGGRGGGRAGGVDGDGDAPAVAAREYPTRCCLTFEPAGAGARCRPMYLTLAILMGGGLVLFGIGGSVSGGLFDALGLTDGSSGSATGGRDTLEDVEKRAAAQVRANPRNAPAWAELARTRFQLAGQGEENYSQAEGTFTGRGKAELGQAVAAWERYLALDPPRPDAGTAALMVQAYGTLERFEAGAHRRSGRRRRPSSISYFQPGGVRLRSRADPQGRPGRGQGGGAGPAGPAGGRPGPDRRRQAHPASAGRGRRGRGRRGGHRPDGRRAAAARVTLDPGGSRSNMPRPGAVSSTGRAGDS